MDAALEATTSTNGDGFSLGWYGEHQDPRLYHEVRPASIAATGCGRENCMLIPRRGNPAGAVRFSP